LNGIHMQMCDSLRIGRLVTADGEHKTYPHIPGLHKSLSAHSYFCHTMGKIAMYFMRMLFRRIKIKGGESERSNHLDPGESPNGQCTIGR
jgi:hypothetical protein